MHSSTYSPIIALLPQLTMPSRASHFLQLYLNTPLTHLTLSSCTCDFLSLLRAQPSPSPTQCAITPSARTPSSSSPPSLSPPPPATTHHRTTSPPPPITNTRAANPSAKPTHHSKSPPTSAPSTCKSTATPATASSSMPSMR